MGNKVLSFLSDIEIPAVVYIALLFGALIISFFAFRFFTDNFLILSIIIIVLSGIILFVFFFLKVMKGQENKAYAIVGLFLVPFLINIPYIDAAVIPLDEVNSNRVDIADIEKLSFDLKDEMSVIKADIALIKTSIANPPASSAPENSNFVLIAFPIIIIQIITTAIMILFLRNR